MISRGSQFKVESFMFRIAKPESLVLLSPSKDDVRPPIFFTAKTRAMHLTLFRSRSEGRTLQSVCH